MDNGIVKMGLDSSQTVKRVRALLGCIPKASEYANHQMFYGLHLIRADGIRFTLSIQGSTGHYSEPRANLPSLAYYEEVEIGIIPDERESSQKQRRGWLQPKDVGFNRVQEHQGGDDVLGWVPVRDLVADLAEFFDAGGEIDALHEDTQKWIDKIVAAVQ